MEAMIAEFEVDFVWLLQAVMHERDFKVTTTYPFPCMIFSLCRSADVPIWHVDQLKTSLTTEFDYRWQIVKDGQFVHGYC